MLQLFLGFVKRLDRCSFASPRRKNTALALGKPVPMPCAGELRKGVAGRHRVRPHHFVIAVWRAKTKSDARLHNEAQARNRSGRTCRGVLRAGAVLHLSGGTRREHRRRTVYHTGHGDSNSLRLEYRFLTFAGTD